MDAKFILTRWLAIEDADGLDAARQKARNLFYAILAVLLIAVIGALRYGNASVGFVLLGVLAGWLGAEASALNARIRDLPIYRQYIDWPRVRQDAGIVKHQPDPDSPRKDT
jgi:hypothetical protein